MDNVLETVNAVFLPHASTTQNATPDELLQILQIKKINKFPLSKRSKQFLEKYYPLATVSDWNDWKWQIRNRVRKIDILEQMIQLTPDERSAIEKRTSNLPIAITPYYLSLFDPLDSQQPIRRTHIPVEDEFTTTPGEDPDPLDEDGDTATPGLVHRYPDRVLFLTTGFCSTYCRYCTRSRMVGETNGEYSFSIRNWEKAIAYIKEHTEIRDCLLSGGDPLSIGDDKLDWLLSRLRAIPHLEFIRIGTKIPVVMPQRITKDLVKMLKKYHPLWMSIHFTHPDELTVETIEACTRLADAGIPLGSQTVLLKGINDSVDVLKPLFHGLLKARVKPYYLYQCDPVSGSAHFRTPVEKGLEIMQQLRGYTTGYAVPTFVIDAPGGGGKIPVLPNYVTGREGDNLLLTNFEGGAYKYPDPGGKFGAAFNKTPVKQHTMGKPLPEKLHIGFTYDLKKEYIEKGYSEEEVAEFDSQETIDAVYNALTSFGHTVERVGNVHALSQRLAKGDRFDLVFNICEGLHGVGREAQVPAILETYQIPYTFSSPDVLCTVQDKHLSKLIVQADGLNTASSFLVKSAEDIAKVNIAYPLFIKPVAEGSSKGITSCSLVKTKQELEERCKAMLNTYKQPVLVESYLSGREFTVGIVDNTVLGVLEMKPTAFGDPTGHTYANKQDCANTMEYFLATDAVGNAAGELALKCWKALSCRDVGRVDIRCDANGIPHFLEVNALAGLNPTISDLTIINRLLGRTYESLIADIIKAACNRLAAASI